jgi:hypothetical protein
MVSKLRFTSDEKQANVSLVFRHDGQVAVLSRRPMAKHEECLAYRHPFSPIQPIVPITSLAKLMTTGTIPTETKSVAASPSMTSDDIFNGIRNRILELIVKYEPIRTTELSLAVKDDTQPLSVNETTPFQCLEALNQLASPLLPHHVYGYMMNGGPKELFHAWWSNMWHAPVSGYHDLAHKLRRRLFASNPTMLSMLQKK